MGKSYNIHPISPITHTYIAYFNFWRLFNINPISTVIVQIHPNITITYFYFYFTSQPLAPQAISPLKSVLSTNSTT
jgi:hypothetical protein